MTPRASIDLGSNSCILLIQSPQGTVVDEARVVGLGAGLGDGGPFRVDRMDAALSALSDYAAIARKHGVDPSTIVAVATSASRRATNTTAFYDRVQAQTGIHFQIISGQEEARLTWLGARSVLSTPTVVVADLGGGSTEVIAGTGPDIAFSTSLEVGSVRLTEAFLGRGVVTAENLAQLNAHLDAITAELELPTAPLIGVAGTVTTLACMELGLKVWNADAVHGSLLHRSALLSAIERLSPVQGAERRAMVPVGGERADFLVAGASVLLRLLAATAQEHMVVSDHGLRHGALLSAPQ